MPTEGNKISNEDIYQLLQNINKNNTNIEKRLERIEINLGRDIKEAQNKLVKLEEENKILRGQLLETQKRQRKYNIVIYGINEKEKEDLHDIVQNIINSKLEIQFEPTDVRDVHRLGKPNNTSKVRPVLVELVSYKKKTSILKKGHKLKGTGVFVSNDLTPEELKEKKILLIHLKQAKERKHDVKLYKNKLIINGETYGIEDLQSIEEITRDTDSDSQEILTIPKKTNNTTPSTSTPCNHHNQNSEEERNSRRLRSNAPNLLKINPLEKKKVNTDNKEEKNKNN